MDFEFEIVESPGSEAMFAILRSFGYIFIAGIVGFENFRLSGRTLLENDDFFNIILLLIFYDNYFDILYLNYCLIFYYILLSYDDF